MHPALSYALLALCAAVFAAGFWLDGQRGGERFPKARRYAMVLQLAAFAGAYLTLRPGRGDDPQAALSQSAAAQQPLMLELYSNY